MHQPRCFSRQCPLCADAEGGDPLSILRLDQGNRLYFETIYADSIALVLSSLLGVPILKKTDIFQQKTSGMKKERPDPFYGQAHTLWPLPSC
jgi:hypothetical protein